MAFRRKIVDALIFSTGLHTLGGACCGFSVSLVYYIEDHQHSFEVNMGLLIKGMAKWSAVGFVTGALFPVSWMFYAYKANGAIEDEK